MDVNFENLKNTFTELVINLKNPLLMDKIKKRATGFDYQKLQNSVDSYLGNVSVLEKSDADELINQINNKAIELLKLTNNEYVENYINQFINLSNYLIEHTPNPQEKQQSKPIDSGHTFEDLFVSELLSKGYRQNTIRREVKLGGYSTDIQIVNEKNEPIAYIELKIKYATGEIEQFFKNIIQHLQNSKVMACRFFLVIKNGNSSEYYELNYIAGFDEKYKKIANFPTYEELKNRGAIAKKSIDALSDWDTFVKTVDFKKLQSIQKGVSDHNAEEGIRVRDFLKNYLVSLQKNNIELSQFKIQLNQAPAQQRYTEANGFRGGFYKGDSYEKSTQLNITFWASWGGGVFIKDNEKLFFNQKEKIAEAKKSFPELKFDENDDNGSIFALRFNPPNLPNETEVIHAFKTLIRLYVYFGIIEDFEENGKASINMDNNSILNGNMIIKKKDEIKASFGVDNIASILSDVIVGQPSDSGMMIGIFGRWGRGKTYLWKKTWEQVHKQDNSFEAVEFSAWKYQDVKSSWAYLYEMFLDKFLDGDKWHQKIRKLFNINKTKYSIYSIVFFIIYTLVSFVWVFFIDKLSLALNFLTFTSLILLLKAFLFYLQHKNAAIGIFKKYFSKTSFKDVLGLQSEIQNELRVLLQTWIPEKNGSKKIVLFVDDLDRCDAKQMLSVLDGLRIILDDEKIYSRLVIVSSIDEEILLKAFLSDKDILCDKDNNGRKYFKEYLEKVFLVGIKLDSLTIDESKEFFKNLTIDKVKSSGIENSQSQDAVIKSTKEEVDETLNIQASNEYDEVYEEEQAIDMFEISENEQKSILDSIEKLENPTPRTIRILYYKYMIVKKILKDKLDSNRLAELLQLLIAFSNDANHKLEDGQNDEFVKAVKMVAVL